MFLQIDLIEFPNDRLVELLFKFGVIRGNVCWADLPQIWNIFKIQNKCDSLFISECCLFDVRGDVERVTSCVRDRSYQQLISWVRPDGAVGVKTKGKERTFGIKQGLNLKSNLNLKDSRCPVMVVFYVVACLN